MAAKSRYDKSPKIADTEGSDKLKVGGPKEPEKGGKPEGAGQQPAKNAKTETKPEHQESKPDVRGKVAPKSLEATGTEESGMPVHARHMMERDRLHSQQMMEKSDMHHRHEREMMGAATGKED